MKLLFLSAVLLVFSATAKNCKSKKAATLPGCYRGKLEIKASCMNYTISIADGLADTSLVAGSWTDETTGKVYKNVFALGSRCSFPEKINEGDEFYFTLDSSAQQDCAVCMMYYPVPPKKLSIKVLDAPCTP